MKKRIVSLVLAFALLLGLCGSSIGLALMASADDSVTIKLHYYRPDGNYSGWDVWIWPDGKDGAGYAFQEEDGDMVATCTLPAGTIKCGYIVRKGNWDAKDVAEDQFIEFPEVTSGVIHVYVTSGVKGQEVVFGEDVTTGVNILSAKYNGKDAISVKLTRQAEGDLATAFTLKQGDTVITPASVEDKGNKVYQLNLSAPLNNFLTYTVSYQDVFKVVTIPNVFSTDAFEEEFTYEGDDLGATWTESATTFRVWAPTAASVKVNLYTGGDASVNDLISQVEMTKDVQGTWVATVEGNLHKTYYTYSVEVAGTVNEACDPYARTTGVNGNRAMVIDLSSTNPEGWENDKDPNGELSIQDAIIYELHIRDLSVNSASGIQNAGKFLGLTELGTKNSYDLPTGLDHIKDLGVTHIHLLPVYDFATVDESKLDTPQFNWGYDPKNYNVPEGSYSTDPYNGEVRVAEFKQMVKALHDNGISVIMDVVYNHVYSAGSFCFNQIVPNYFSRVSDSGVYSNGSGCGNDTATERSMVRKYIVDSVLYWANEYHIDGFRFDLVGLIDTQTINEIMTEVHKTHPNVIFYGEGWTMSTTLTKDGVTLTTQTNASKVPGFAFFSDGFRDALKGSVFDNAAKGFVSGGTGFLGSARKTWMAVTNWSSNPTQTIQYSNCHDNMTLFDRIVNSTPGASFADQVKMNNLAGAMTLTAQGVSFLHAGEEMLRSKPLGDGTFSHNSYNASDEVNNLRWDMLGEEAYQNTYQYYKGLIAFRKAHPLLRLNSAAQINKCIEIINGENNVAIFHMTDVENVDSAEAMFLVFNPNSTATTVTLPEGAWDVYINGEKADTDVIATVAGSVTVDAISAMVLVQSSTTVDPVEPGDTNTTSAFPWAIVGGIAGVVALVAAAVGITVAVMKKKEK